MGATPHQVRNKLARLTAVAIVITAASAWLITTLMDSLGMNERPPTLLGAQAVNSSQDSADAEGQRDLRRLMVESQLRARDIKDPRVLEAMGRVPRHLFVPEKDRQLAYADGALPIGHQQTISQPYIVALMTQLARPDPQSKALDVGTGSGYQAAVLGELCKQVFSIEIVEPLALAAKERLANYKNITVRHGDGYRGWAKQAPFDLIIVAAAPDHIPAPLIEQLAPGGRLVIPVGGNRQRLMVVTKDAAGKVDQRTVIAVAFVPMTGPSVQE